MRQWLHMCYYRETSGVVTLCGYDKRHSPNRFARAARAESIDKKSIKREWALDE